MAGDSEAGYGSIPTTEGGAAASTPTSMKNAIIAEVFGTCTLVQIGCGGLCAGLFLGVSRGLWQEAAVWILGATLAIFATGSVSGGHLNPAVSFAFALVRPADFPLTKLIPYWIAQVAGGFLAGLINLCIFHAAISDYEERHDITRGDPDSIQSASVFGDYWSLSPGCNSTAQAIFIEAFGTGFLTFVVFAVTHPKNNVPSGAVAPLVGSAIGSAIFLLGALTGAGINPARDLGPRLVTLFAGWGTASMTNVLAYIVGPLLGGPIGAALVDKVLYA